MSLLDSAPISLSLSGFFVPGSLSHGHATGKTDTRYSPGNGNLDARNIIPVSNWVYVYYILTDKMRKAGRSRLSRFQRELFGNTRMFSEI